MDMTVVNCELEQKLEKLGGVMCEFMDMLERVENRVESLNLSLDGLFIRICKLEEKVIEGGMYDSNI